MRFLAILILLSPFLVQSQSGRFTKLVWSDEFSNFGPLDDEKWHHQTELPNGVSWWNGEIQHYTDRTDNARQEFGNLHLTAKREQFTDQGLTTDFTSARLNSKFAFTYGRVEVRAKLPTGIGTWPAIWMLGKNIDEKGAYWQPTHGDTPWPECGEIDIMEHWGTNQDYVSSAIHTPSSHGGTQNVGGRTVSDVSNSFHVYALEWTEDKMVFSIDSVEHYTYEPAVKDMDTWPFDADQYILLNVAILPSIDANFTESAMVVDYVRVYQEPDPVGVETGAAPEFRLYPNPAQDYVMIEFEDELEHKVVVRDLLGVVFEMTAVDDSILLNLSGWTAGVYQVFIDDRMFQKIVTI